MTSHLDPTRREPHRAVRFSGDGRPVPRLSRASTVHDLPRFGARAAGAWYVLELNDPPRGPNEIQFRVPWHLLSISLRPQRGRAYALGYSDRRVEDLATPAGVATWVPAHERMWLRFADPSRYVNVVVDPARAARLLGGDGGGGALPDSFAYHHDASLAALGRAIAAALEARRAAEARWPPGGEAGAGAHSLYLETLAAAALGGLAALRARGGHSPGGDNAFRRPPRGGMRRVLESIEDNLDDAGGGALSVAALAGLSGLGAMSFCRAFKAATGLPPHRYVLARRVERARALLADGTLPVAEVALACGFAHQAHFTTVFRRATGTAPAAYRRAARL